jgi:excisionase family DNA binding protein
MPASNQHHTLQEPAGNFSVNMAAAYLSVHRSTIERLLHAGEFGRDWWRIGKKIIIPKENVFAYERREREKRLGTIAA